MLKAAKNILMENILELLSQSREARRKEDWDKLEEISVKIFKSIYKGDTPDESTLKEIVQGYLSSIVGAGEFLTNVSNGNGQRFEIGLGKLFEFISRKNLTYNSIDLLLLAAREISLLSLDPITANRNKIAKHLREIARPDLSIIICQQILEDSRLNYYSLTVLCGAYCDLLQFDRAIEVAQVALKYQPSSGRSFPLNSLTRAHTLKFKSNGDFAEIDKALEYGHQSLEIKVDRYAANAFVAAAIASMYEKEIEYAKSILERVEPDLRTVDIAALFQAYKAAQNLKPGEQVVEVIDETESEGQTGGLSSLFDLVERDEGFTPDVRNLRNMSIRFAQGGWFLQGLSNIPCPQCQTISLHSYRKHFKRYGKDMHYWALVCDSCKTASDSIDFDRKEFAYISGFLEERFPVQNLCDVCINSKGN